MRCKAAPGKEGLYLGRDFVPVQRQPAGGGRLHPLMSSGAHSGLLLLCGKGLMALGAQDLGLLSALPLIGLASRPALPALALRSFAPRRFQLVPFDLLLLALSLLLRVEPGPAR